MVAVVIISWNVNGLTACMGKNGFEPIMALQPDIVCLQEVKTSRRPKVLLGYQHYWETYAHMTSAWRVRVTLGGGYT